MRYELTTETRSRIGLDKKTTFNRLFQDLLNNGLEGLILLQFIRGGHKHAGVFHGSDQLRDLLISNLLRLCYLPKRHWNQMDETRRYVADAHLKPHRDDLPRKIDVRMDLMSG